MHRLQAKGFISLHNGPSGVYALCCQGDVVYIGQSSNVYKRVRQHHNSRLWYWDQVLVFWCPEAELLDLEAKLIRELLPVHNKQIPDPPARLKINLCALLGIRGPVDRRG